MNVNKINPLPQKSHFDRLSVTKIIYLFTFTLFLISSAYSQDGFVIVKGKEIVTPDGKPILLKGMNLGNWLVPEGYMFIKMLTPSAD
jgi:hypothetical protein